MDLCVLCVGNRDGGDDAIGPYIADHLPSTKTRTVIDAATVPENFTGVIKKLKPKKLLIIDAVEMGLKPGEIRIVPKEKIGVMHVSTHGIPLSILINYLEQYLKHISLLGIQPKTMIGDMSIIVRGSGDQVMQYIENNTYQCVELLQ